MIIVQGTTPTHSFAIPFDTSTVQIARFVYSQNGEVKVLKDSREGQATINTDGTVTTNLSQEDTYKLTPDAPVKLVLRILTKKGEALVSDPVRGICYGCDCKEVLA